MQVLRLLSQSRLNSFPLRHVRAQNETWNGAGDHERDQQQEGVVEVRASERAAARQRPPYCERRKDECGC